MKTLFLIFACFLTIVNAQPSKSELTGNLQTDSKFLLSLTENNTAPEIYLPSESSSSDKSPFLAGILSFVIPGAGEFYSERYLKAGIFLAVEAAVITTAIIYNKKGNDKTDEFENYADNNWSVVKYAQWLIDYKNAPQEIIINSDPNLPPWERVDWNLLNASETGSHKLVSHGEQQYYELIGKYHQYSPGWDDFSSGGSLIPSPHFESYSVERGKANDYYNAASTAVIGIYINHFLSALDGVWSATRFNKDLAVKARVQKFDLADRSILIPTLNFKYNF